MNYQTSNGWAPIDSTLVDSSRKGFRWQNKAGSFTAAFASTLGSRYLQIDDHGTSVEFGAVGAGPAPGSASGDTATYRNAFTDTDLTYQVTGSAVEESIVLRSSAAPSSYQFTVSQPAAGPRLRTHKLPDGSWAFDRPGTGGPLFVLAAPRAFSQPSGKMVPTDRAPHAQMTVTPQGSTFDVRISVDSKWLTAPGRTFPVVVDPTVTIQPDSQDASFTANYSNYTPYVSNRIFIGTDNAYVWRGALQFDLGAIPAGTAVSSAQLGLYDDGYCISWTGLATCPGNTHTLEAHQMTAPWTTSSTTGQVQFDPTVLSSVSVSDYNTTAQWLYWPMTSLVQSWLNGSQANDGLLLKDSSEPLSNSGVAVPSSSYGTTSVEPQLQVTYTSDAVTLLPPDTLHSNGAELHWTTYTGPSGAPFSQYAVYRSRTPGFTPGPSTLLTTITDPTVTSYTDTTAAANATFTYAVVANSSKSNEVSVTLPADGTATKTLQPDAASSQDTYVDYSNQLTNCATYGTDPLIYVGTTSTDIFRGLLHFNLNAIPATANITSAKLSVWQQYTDPNAVTVELHQLTRAWTPGSGSNAHLACTGDGATWYDATGGVSWTSQGGDYAAAAAASVAKPANQQAGFDTFDITSLAQQWTDGSAANLGVLLKLANESLTAGNYLAYDSADFTANPGVRPQLVVTYNDGSHAVAPTVSLAAPAAGGTVSGTAAALTAAASDDGAVDHVDLLVDGTVVGTATSAPYVVNWNSTTATNGTHTVTARAVDNAGNTTTSAPVSFTVDNVAPPTVSISSPAANATVSGTAVNVTASAAATSPHTLSKVDFYWDNQQFATATTSPYTVAWNTLDANNTAYDGTHTLTAKATDSSGQSTVSAPVTVTVANTTGTLYRAGLTLASGSATPTQVSDDPNASTQQQFGVNVTVTNNSSSTFSSSGDTLAYRWYSPDNPAVVTSGPATALGSNLKPGRSATVKLLVSPPTLAAGVNSAQYQLVYDLYDSASKTWFAAKGNPPVTAQVQVLRKSPVLLGLEKYYQYDSHPLGAGLSSLTNLASGNLVLNATPWDLPGRGLSSVLSLTYNGLENHSHSPAGNNWSLAISSLIRFGTPLDIHPNNADTIAGVSNKLIGVTDGDGSQLIFIGTTNPNGTTSWTPPAGVDLYLRSTTTDTNSTTYWALSRPDHVTFYYTYAGWPTSVVDKNGNTISFTETATPPGDDPGGPPYRITKITDPGGRAITVTYYAKGQTDNAHQRGRISDISDHLGHGLHFDYYTDGNLLRLTERGGTNADGSLLADRSWVFTYLTSNGTGPAIPNAADRVNPDPKTPNEDSQIYSVRDPNGHESTYAYYLNSDGPTLAGRVKTFTDRASKTTSYAYNTSTSTTTVTDPLSHATSYVYDGLGRVTGITNALSQTTSLTWTGDNEVSKVSEPSGAYSSYAYNANGYLTDFTDQAGDHTKLTYTDKALDATDTGTHWSLLAAKTDPNGVAAGSGYLWQFAYDSAGNLTTVTDPRNNTTSYCYNLTTAPACNGANDATSPGTIATVTDFNGHTTSYANYDPNGYPQKITDPLGRVTQLGFDADGNQLWVQDPLHAADSGTDTASYRDYFSYDSFNRLDRQSQPKSTSLARGQLIFTDASYDPNDNLLSTQAPHYGLADGGNGALTSYAYDVLDRQTLTTSPDTEADPAGERTKTVYDADGNVLSRTRPIGVQSGLSNDHTTGYVYDALNRITEQTDYTVDSSGTVTGTRNTFNCYDNVGNLVTVTAPNAGLSSAPACPATVAHTTTYSYDAAHRLLSTKDPDGNTTSQTYDADGNVLTSTDANNNVTTNSYDQRDNLTKTVAPYVHGGRATTTEYTYDPNGNKTTLISPRAYDASSDKVTFTNYVTSYSYDADNELTRVTTPSDANTPATYIHYYYDADGHQSAVSLPVTTSDPTQVAAAAKTVETLYDPGWIAASTDPDRPAVRYDYTATGWQTSRIPDNTATGTADTASAQYWTYTPDGKISSYTDQGGQASRYYYNADDQLTYAKTAHGLTSPTQTPIEIYADYTGNDQLAATHYRPTAASTYYGTSYSYDADGNSIERDDNATQTLASQTTNSAGVPTSWTFTQTAPPDYNSLVYDNADRLTTQYDKGTTNTCSQRIDTTWTPTGRETSRTINAAGTGCTYTPKQTTTWTYFDNGKLATDKITNGAGSVLETHTVGYETNGVYLDGNRTTDTFALNGPGSTTCTGSTPVCTATYSYDAQDRVVSATDGHGGTTSYTFDQSNNADPTIRAGNITTQTTPTGTTTNTYTGTQLTSSTTGGTTADYWYDPLGRLTCVTTTAGNADSCNSVGTGSTVSSAVIHAYSYDYMDRFTASHTYSAGTLIDQATYAYDALDRTAQEVETHPSANINRTTTFNYEGLTNNVTQETQNNTGATTNTDIKTYSYDAYGHRITLNDATTSNGTTTTGTYTYGYDVHDDVSLLVNEANGAAKASYAYTPYGTDDTALSKGDTAVDAPFNPYRYTGKRYDTGSQTYDMGVRRFDPNAGHFLQLDQYQGALSDLGLSSDPLTQNRYELAAGNPLSAVEVDGHVAIPDGGGGGSPSPSPTTSSSLFQLLVAPILAGGPSGSASGSTREGPQPPATNPISAQHVAQDASLYGPIQLFTEYRARNSYNAGAKAIAQESQLLLLLGMPEDEVAKAASAAREDLRQAVRASYPSLVSLFGEHRVDIDYLRNVKGKDWAGIIESASKPNVRFNTFAAAGKYAGLAGVLFNAGFSAYQIAESPATDRIQVAAQDVGALGGALAGAETGAEGGAVVGTAVAGPVGTAVGGIVGGIGGSIAGGIGGSYIGKWLAGL